MLLLIIGIVGFITASGYLVLARSNYDDYVAFLCVFCQFVLVKTKSNFLSNHKRAKKQTVAVLLPPGIVNGEFVNEIMVTY